MKTLKIIGILLITLSVYTKSYSQNPNKTYYYFAMATAFVDGEGKKAIISNVRTTTCDKYRFSSGLSTAIENQLGDYLKAEYNNWHKYDKQAFAYFETLEEAKRQRQKYIGQKKNSGYSVTKDIYFSFSCN